jgi:isoleucyl-tRNA synthetase
VAVHPKLDYSLVRLVDDNVPDDQADFYILGSDRVNAFETELGQALQVVDTVSGSSLIGSSYLHPFWKDNKPIIEGHHVTADSGTGLVHTAPGHGLEDYDACSSLGIAPFSPGKKQKDRPILITHSLFSSI